MFDCGNFAKSWSYPNTKQDIEYEINKSINDRTKSLMKQLYCLEWGKNMNKSEDKGTNNEI